MTTSAAMLTEPPHDRPQLTDRRQEVGFADVGAAQSPAAFAVRGCRADQGLGRHEASILLGSRKASAGPREGLQDRPAAASRQDFERGTQGEAPPRIEQVVVVEVRVHVAGSAADDSRAPARRANASSAARRRAGTPPRTVQSTRPSSRTLARTASSVYQPPPQKNVGSRPCARIHSASSRTRSAGIAAGRTRVRRARPVRVQSERRARRRGAGALEPALLVLAERRVRRTHERDHVEAAGPPALERVEARPRLVVERPLEMAGDDRDGRARHTVPHVRDLRTLFAVRRAAGRRSSTRCARGSGTAAPTRARPTRSARCVLGHQRLQVLDPELGYQPVANETGDVVAVFNGELYNFARAARASSPRAGTRFAAAATRR